MNKIFKYDLYERDNKWYFQGPKNVIVIRTDEVHDDYYDGFFVWCIVDPDDKEFVEHQTVFSPTVKDYAGVSKQIGFLEEQYVVLPDKCSIQGLCSHYGRAYLYYYHHGPFYKVKPRKLIFRKTGQEIGYPLDNIIYIGWTALFIKQELAVYGFLVNE